jgi:alkaline phosphatase D
VILWTRVTPTPDGTPGSGKGAPATVRWVIAADPELRRVVLRGVARTSAASDHTVKVDARGLTPDTRYWYGFTVGRASSPLGSTRTAPAPDAANERLRFGMVSCSNYTGGYFSAYRHLATRDDLDFVVHLGDYLYEYGNDEDRYGPESLRGGARGRAGGAAAFTSPLIPPHDTAPFSGRSRGCPTQCASAWWTTRP